MNFSTWWETTGKKLYQVYKDKFPEEDAVRLTAQSAHLHGADIMFGILKPETHENQTN